MLENEIHNFERFNYKQKFFSLNEILLTHVNFQPIKNWQILEAKKLYSISVQILFRMFD